MENRLDVLAELDARIDMREDDLAAWQREVEFYRTVVGGYAILANAQNMVATIRENLINLRYQRTLIEWPES